VGATVRHWGHVRVFSPWRYNIDAVAAAMLERAGWTMPDPEHLPTGRELVEQYLEPLAARTELKSRITTNARVTSVARTGFDKAKTTGREAAPFEIRYRNGKSLALVEADAVIDASGTWFAPNPAGANGLEAIGEAGHQDRIAYGMPDVLGAECNRYAGRTVAVLGAGHSAAGTIVDLKRLQDDHPQTRIIWVLRGEEPQKSFGGGASDKLPTRGELGRVFGRIVEAGGVRVEAGFRLSHIGSSKDGRLRLGAGSACCGRHVLADELIVATGFRPDLSFLREVRTGLDPALECPPLLAPLIDPNFHSCGTVPPHGARELAQPEPDFYFAGMKSYGRAPTFLMMTGYEQVRSIVAEIAGDHEAAKRVEISLPETGVCSGPADTGDDIGCCGGPALEDQSACCKADEAAKSAGRAGCGCSGS